MLHWKSGHHFLLQLGGGYKLGVSKMVALRRPGLVLRRNPCVQKKLPNLCAASKVTKNQV